MDVVKLIAILFSFYNFKDDVPDLDVWLHRLQDHFTSPTIHNELLEIMASTIVRKIAHRLSEDMFSIMVDETTGHF